MHFLKIHKIHFLRCINAVGCVKKDTHLGAYTKCREFSQCSRMFLSTINCLTLGTVVTLFLFIQSSVPIYSFIYLPQNPHVYLFSQLLPRTYFYLFIYRRIPVFIYLFSYCRVPIFFLFIADRMEQHLEVTWTIGSGLSS